MEVPSLDALLRDTWKGWSHEFRRCRHSMSEDAVHDLRVQSRRVMAILALFEAGPHHRARPIRKVVRATLDALSKLRDVHVQREAARSLVQAHPATQAFVDHLDRRERRLRKAASADLRHVHPHSATRACARLAHAAGHETRDSAARLARRALADAWEKVEERLQALDTADLRTIHRVRVALKSVRYMFEAGIGVGRLDPRLKALDAKDLVIAVRRMGWLHDVEALFDRLDGFAKKRDTHAAAVATARAALTRRRSRLLRQVMADLPALRASGTSLRLPRAASARHAPQRRGR